MLSEILFRKESITEKTEIIAKLEQDIRNLHKQSQFKRLSSSLYSENMLDSFQKSEKFQLTLEISQLRNDNDILKEDIKVFDQLTKDLKEELGKRTIENESLAEKYEFSQEKISELEKSLVKCRNDINYLTTR